MVRCRAILVLALFVYLSLGHSRRVVAVLGCSYDAHQKIASVDITSRKQAAGPSSAKSLAALLVAQRTGSDLGHIISMHDQSLDSSGSRAIVAGHAPLRSSKRSSCSNQTAKAMLEIVRGGGDCEDSKLSVENEHRKPADGGESGLQKLRSGSRQEASSGVVSSPSWHAQRIPRRYCLGVYSGVMYATPHLTSVGRIPSNDTRQEREVDVGSPKPQTSPELMAFLPGRPEIDMEQVEESLARGERWESLQMNGSAAIGQVVIDVDAPAQEVWKQLLGFDTYSSKVPWVRQSEVYENSRDGGRTRIGVKFVFNAFLGVQCTNYLSHLYDKGKNSMTWTLDSSEGRKSDSDEEQGHWHVESHPHDPSKARVFYEIGLAYRDRWLPQIAIDRVVRRLMGDAATWIKRESELAVLNSETFEEASTHQNDEPREGDELASASVEDKKLRPFEPGRLSAFNDDEVDATLKDGKIWQSLKLIGKTAVGRACMDVNASASVVWNQLLDFTSYSDKIPRLSASEVYSRTGQGSKLEHIFVKFVYSVFPGVKYTFYVDHVHAKAKNSLTWFLDVNDSLTSDFEDEQGQWHVEPHQSDSSKARVWYEIGITYPRWLPQMMIKRITRRVISEATKWVKRESELEEVKAVEEGAEAEEETRREETRAELENSASDVVEVVNAPNGLVPFQRGRPSLKKEPDEELLAQGKASQVLQIHGKIAIGQAVIDVEAPPDVVMQELLDFESYHQKVPRLRTSEVYRTTKEGNKIEHSFVKFIYDSFPGVSYTYNVEHSYEKSKNSVTWTLDCTDGVKSDADDEQGHWHVEPHPEDSSKSRVFYEIGLVYPWWLPRMSIAHFANRAIADATTWIKREGELAAKKLIAEKAKAEKVKAEKAKEQAAKLKDSKGKRSNLKKLVPFEQGAPAIASDPKIQEQIEQKLNHGEMWQSLNVDGNAVVGQVAFDIDAPASVIWSQLLDLATYAQKMPGIRSSIIYKEGEEKNNIQRSFVKLVNPVFPGLKLSYHLEHAFDPGKKSMVFYLDDSKKNDFKEVQGHWYVENHPSSDLKSRVIYEIGLVTPGFVPQKMIDKVAQKAMHGSVSWVKRESELEANGGIEDEETKKLLPFQRGRPPLIMDFVERVLTRGQAWQSIQIIGKTAVGQAVVDVAAPPNVVWNQLLDFHKHPDKAYHVRESEVYKRTVEGGSIEQIYVKLVYTLFPGLDFTYHVKHTYEPGQNSISWSLDGNKNNDFLEDEGHWHVEPHPDDPLKSRVFFEVGIVYPRWLPRRVMAGLAQRYIENATPWLQKASESEAKRLGAAASTVSVSSESLLHSKRRK